MDCIREAAGWKVHHCDYCDSDVYAENTEINKIILSPSIQQKEGFQPQEGFHFSKSLNMAVHDVKHSEEERLNWLYPRQNKAAWEEVTRITEMTSRYINAEQILMEKRIWYQTFF